MFLTTTTTTSKPRTPKGVKLKQDPQTPELLHQGGAASAATATVVEKRKRTDEDNPAEKLRRVMPPPSARVKQTPPTPAKSTVRRRRFTPENDHSSEKVLEAWKRGKKVKEFLGNNPVQALFHLKKLLNYYDPSQHYVINVQIIGEISDIQYYLDFKDDSPHTEIINLLKETLYGLYYGNASFVVKAHIPIKCARLFALIKK